MLVYFAFVIGVGVALKRSATTSVGFFQAGRAIPAWVCGLAFISANLGAQEIIGMAASGAKYGISTSHFYWIGAIPATVFSSGISMYAMAKLLQILHVFDSPFAALGLGPQYIFHVCIVSSAIVVLVYVL